MSCGGQTQILMTLQQTFYQLSHLPSLPYKLYPALKYYTSSCSTETLVCICICVYDVYVHVYVYMFMYTFGEHSDYISISISRLCYVRPRRTHHWDKLSLKYLGVPQLRIFSNASFDLYNNPIR